MVFEVIPTMKALLLLNTDVFHIIIAFLSLSTKFLMGMGFVYAYDFNYIESVLFSIAGGMFGVFVFTYFSHLFYKKSKQKMSRWKRFLVFVKNRLGLIGIAILTPVILTIPVGTILAASIERSKTKIMIYMLISIILWSFALVGIKFLTGINLTLH